MRPVNNNKKINDKEYRSIALINAIDLLHQLIDSDLLTQCITIYVIH